MSSLICRCHVLSGSHLRIVPTWLCKVHHSWVTLLASLLWACPNQPKRPLRISSSIGERCNMRRISSFRIWARLNTAMISRIILISVIEIFLFLFTFIAQLSLPYFRAGLITASYTFASSLRGNLPVVQYSGQLSPAWPRSLHAKVHVSVDGKLEEIDEFVFAPIISEAVAVRIMTLAHLGLLPRQL